MKVGIINAYYYPEIIGGAELSVKKLAEGLVNKGLEVFVITTGENNVVDYIEGVKVYRLKTNNFFRVGKYKNPIKKVTDRLLDIYNPFNFKKINIILRKEKPNIVHTNNLYGISPIVYNAAKINSIKIVHTLRDYYILCPRVNLLNKKNEICNNPCISCQLYRGVNRYLFKNIDALTAPSQFTNRIFNDNDFFKHINSYTIHNAIEIDYKELEETRLYRINKKRDSLRFVYLGALSKHKGIIELINSFSKIENDSVSLEIAGEGNLRGFIQGEAKKDNRIKLHRFLNEKEKKNLLLDSDILVIPSMWYEPFGRVVIEAYKYGLPVIGSNLGGIPEIIDNYSTGVIFNPESEDSLINAFNYFIDNKKLINEIVNNCIKKLHEFDLDIQIEQFVDLYSSLVDSGDHR
ncbi:glycosyltransferase family 4 protein [Paenibacillus sp. 7124]|uniref:Glycosyltransferase family 4 protein n=1 Tax=Paenibacillus apii TaxID=1850370 RepID=A0A6M1PM43_9BACL|nr:glycosyltransferase family 4 protein [Paenibacillus apii]NGM83574.1 glycosyltransferase family 4 protein [Paenibacillus apii]